MIKTLRDELMAKEDLYEGLKVKNVSKYIHHIEDLELFMFCMTKLKVLKPQSQQIVDLYNFKRTLNIKPSKYQNEEEKVGFEEKQKKFEPYT